MVRRLVGIFMLKSFVRIVYFWVLSLALTNSFGFTATPAMAEPLGSFMESKAPLAAPSRASERRALKRKIETLSKEIDALRKKREEALSRGRLSEAAKFQNEIERKRETRKRLKEELSVLNRCVAEEINFKIAIDNNSDHRLTLYLRSGPQFGYKLVKIDNVPPRVGGVLVMNLKEIGLYLDLFASDFTIVAVAKVNLQEVQSSRTFQIYPVPSKVPCIKSYKKWEFFNRSFRPVFLYQLFEVTNCRALFIGREEELKHRTKSSFSGCGTSSDPVTYIALSQAFKDISSAEQEFCSSVKGKGWWNLGACQRVYCLSEGQCSPATSGDYYWGCESSLQEAAKNYCPHLAY